MKIFTVGQVISSNQGFSFTYYEDGKRKTSREQYKSTYHATMAMRELVRNLQKNEKEEEKDRHRH